MLELTLEGVRVQMDNGAYQFLLGSDVLSAQGGLMKATAVKPGEEVGW